MEQLMSYVWLLWLGCGCAGGVIYLFKRRTTSHDIFFARYFLGAYVICIILGPIALLYNAWSFRGGPR